MDKIMKLQEEITNYLGIMSLPVTFEDLGIDDSRLYLENEYIAINIKHKNNFLECAKCLTHENRHVFQVIYCNIYDNARSARWKQLLSTQINSTNLNGNYDKYLSQELEIDAFAFTRYYLKKFHNINVENKIKGFDFLLDNYIVEHSDIL